MNFQRNCPNCDSVINYKHKGSMINAHKKKSICSTCCSKLFGWNKLNADVSIGIRKNGFSEKTHTTETKTKLSASRILNENKYKTDSFRKKISESTEGNKNPMFGKTFYDVWMKKYGKIEADKRLIEHGKNSARPGKLNGMYGKPSPNGSGNGWSGWYKGWFFRSLKELYFMINVIEKDGLKWDSGEKGCYKVDWELNGVKRTYHSDFIIDNKMIEIKPKKLWTSLLVKAKREAAEKWCEKNEMIYELIDSPAFNVNDIKPLIESGLVKFTNRYEKKYLELVLNA